MLTGIIGKIIFRRQEVQGHHDAVIEFPFFRIGHVDSLHDLARQARAEVSRPRHFGLLNLQPVRILNRTFILVTNANADKPACCS